MKTVCVIEGNIVERQGFLEKIKNSLGDHELIEVDKDDKYDVVEHMISEISCFGARKLFVVKELPQIEIKSKDGSDSSDDKKSQMRTKVLGQFKKIFKDIPRGNIVVFDNINISSSPFLQEVEKFGSIHKFKQKLSKDEARRVISSYFSKHKIDIEHDALELIVESLSISSPDIDIDKMRLLLIQLYHYVYGKNVMKKKDVFDICSTSKEFIVWSLYNILDNVDGEKVETKFSRAYCLVYDFLNNVRYFQHEATMILRSMLWRYGLIMMARGGIESRVSKKDIADEILNIKKLSPSGKSQKIVMSPKEDQLEYSVNAINNIMQKRGGVDVLTLYKYDDLLKIYHAIYKAIVKIRTGCSDSEVITLMQIVLLTICGDILNTTFWNDVLRHSKVLR